MPTLALSMIVKNGERDLPACLASVQGLVSEIVIADTGSSDSSIAIAREFGANVFSIDWEKDFAKARNQSLARVSADWVLMLDADEQLDPLAGQALAALLADRNADGYQVVIRNYVMSLQTKIWDRPAVANDGAFEPARKAVAFVDHENVRLFRRDPKIFFTGRVHETVGWQILSNGRALRSSNLKIHHLGMLRSAEERAQKLLFYRDLGREKVKDMPQNSQAHFELGVSELENFGDAQQALEAIDRACALDPKFGVAWFFAGVCRLRLGRFTEALSCFDTAAKAGHKTIPLAESTGDAHYNLGDYVSAAAHYRQGLKRDPANATLESKLGLSEARSGNPHGGLKKIARAVNKDPSNPELYDRLIAANVWLNRLPAAAAIAEQKLENVQPRPEDFLRAASIWAKLHEWDHAVRILRKGAVTFPDAGPLRTSLFEIETHRTKDSENQRPTIAPSDSTYD